MKDQREFFAPDIHPDAFIAPGARVLGRVTVAREASVWFGCVIRGDIEPILIGERSAIQDQSVIHIDRGAPTWIGARVGIGHRSLIHGCVIEDDCLIGMGAIVLTGAVVETGSVIGAGAVVTEGTRVPSGSLAVGVPARIVGPVNDELRQRIERTWRDYLELARAHRSGLYQGQDGG